MQFPFTEDKTYEEGGFIGHTFNIYRNEMLTNTFPFMESVTFMAKGNTAQGWHWRVLESILYIMDDTGDIQFSFNGVEILNGKVVIVGVKLANGAEKRIVMREHIPLSNKDWKIKISSCQANHKILSKLLKSLKKDGVPDSKIKVIIGSVPYVKEFKSKFRDIEFRSSEQNLKGFTALGTLVAGEDQLVEYGKYYMLLHDTCMVVSGFHKWLDNVDIGLNPDIILLRPPEEDLELGIYSGDFLLDQDDLDTVKPSKMLHFLIGRAKVVMVVGGHKIQKLPEDHYHDGITRKQLTFARPHVMKLKKAQKTGRKR